MRSVMTHQDALQFLKRMRDDPSFLNMNTALTIERLARLVERDNEVLNIDELIARYEAS